MSTPADPEEEVEIFVPDFRELLPDGRRISIAVTVKHNGKWRFHKSDPDTVFPSDFHGDRQDDAEKLDMYTGEVWSSKTNQRLYTMPEKAMRFIFAELERRKQDHFIAKMSDRAKFSYVKN